MASYLPYALGALTTTTLFIFKDKIPKLPLRLRHEGFQKQGTNAKNNPLAVNNATSTLFKETAKAFDTKRQHTNEALPQTPWSKHEVLIPITDLSERFSHSPEAFIGKSFIVPVWQDHMCSPYEAPHLTGTGICGNTSYPLQFEEAANHSYSKNMVGALPIICIVAYKLLTSNVIKKRFNQCIALVQTCARKCKL